MSVPLHSTDGTALQCITLALGWDPSEASLGVDPAATANRFDVNIAALIFGEDRLLDAVYYENLSTPDGSIRHTGDNLTGEGIGDNEAIVVELARVPAEVTTIIVVVTSYTAKPFTEIPNAYCRISDAASLLEIARYILTGGPHTAFVVGALTRTSPAWTFVSIGAGIPATHVVEAVPYLAPYLSPEQRSFG